MINNDRSITSHKPASKDDWQKVKGKPYLFLRYRKESDKQDATYSKIWYYRRRYPKEFGIDKTMRLKIGEYPTVSMAMAFDKWREYNEIIAQGIEPSAYFEQQTKERERQAKNNFSALCDEWASAQGWKDNTAKRRAYNLNLFKKAFGTRSMNSISRADIVELLQQIERTHRQRKDPSLPSDKADRCKGMLIDIFSWATIKGYCTDNPPRT